MWPLQGFEIHFQKLIWLPHCFIKAIKSVYLAWFISPDRLSYTFQHAFPPPALCAGMYLFFFFLPLFLYCSNSFFEAMSWMLPSVWSPSIPLPWRESLPSVLSQNLVTSQSTITRCFTEVICLVNPSKPRTMIYTSVCMSAQLLQSMPQFQYYVTAC